MSESSPEIQLRMDRGRLRDALLQRATSLLLLLVLATYIVLAILYQLAVPWVCRLDEPWHTAHSAYDPVKLGRITVRPATALAIQESAPLPGTIHIDTDLPLINWQLGEAGSEGLCITLWWRVGTGHREDLTVFAYAYGVCDRWVAEEDGSLRQGKYSISMWKAQDIVRDWHCFLPPPGQNFARVEVRLYDPSTMERLVAYDGDVKRLPNGAASPEIHL